MRINQYMPVSIKRLLWKIQELRKPMEKFRPAMTVRSQAFFADRVIRRFYSMVITNLKAYPKTLDELKRSKLYNTWWYYTIELLPDLITKGIYPEKLPFLPRIMLRNCKLCGMDCLDLGSMEGLIPTLMCRQGARSVLATDSSYHCFEKMVAIKKYYDVDFKFREIGLMYDLSKKLKHSGEDSFDLINLSGVLYHVYSPMHVLAGIRPLLKRNGLLIVSTNVVNRPGFVMEFNTGGRLQGENNTFWYISIQLFDYMLRYFKLLPIDCLYHSWQPDDPVRYTEAVNAGYLSVVCRATDELSSLTRDKWMMDSTKKSWEYLGLCNEKVLSIQPVSNIEYTPPLDQRFIADDGKSIDLMRAVQGKKTVIYAEQLHDTHLLRLTDRV